MTTYLIDTYYVEYKDGTIGPVQNRATADYLIMSEVAVRVVDIQREKLGL
jgi:hypothetical protein